MTSKDGSVPLCVDLDGTLVRTNTLVETIAGAIRQSPLLIFLIPLWALRGQAYLWASLAARYRPDASLLPYSDGVLDLLRAERATGRAVILATGANEQMARDIADHLGLFSAVYASDAVEHLVSRRKADLLAAKFGEKGFDYVGDSLADVEIFRRCRRAYVIRPSRGLAAKLKRESIQAERVHDTDGDSSGLLSSARPKQWAKNVLVFVPLVLGHRFRDMPALVDSVYTFLLLCLASSSVYMLNDMLDVEADRQHPIKKRRPFARGTVSMKRGVAIAGLLAISAVSLGWLVAPAVSLLLAGYLAGTLMYSVWLKRLLVIDMIMLASFYVFRVYLGSAATDIRISSWTALFCLFIFSGLAAVKRYAEIRNRALRSSESVNRRAYKEEDAMPLLSTGTSAFIGAIIALGLYLGSPDVQGLYQRPDLLWLVCPVLLGWSSRIWILGHRGELSDEDPVAFALRDRWSHGAAVLSGVIFWLAL
jgi:4-hydroxybenzoate polyprenyltransferase